VGIVVLHIRRGATAVSILEMLEAFFKRTGLVLELSGNLAIIEPGRVRIRKGRFQHVLSIVKDHGRRLFNLAYRICGDE
jgi:hypothetical protein